MAFDIQIATDENFADIVESATVEETTYQSGVLPYSTQHYWRVREDAGDWVSRNFTVQADPASSSTDTEQGDRDALLAMNSSLNGLGWDNGVITGGDLNTLAGVTAEDQGGEQRVVEIDLYNSGIGGDLPEEIGNFRRIRHFDLRRNSNIFSKIPSSIENWVNIELLMFSNGDGYKEQPTNNNPHPGKTPSAGQSKYYGIIPDVFDQMPNLDVFELAWNTDLDPQPFPSTLYQHANIRWLILTANSMEGELQDIFNLPKLEVFFLGNNNWSGTLPSSLSNSPLLDKFMIGHSDEWSDSGNITNRLTGTIPDSWGSLVNMKRIFLNNHNFDGEIPNFVVENWTELREVSLNNNNFTGEIPAGFGNANITVFMLEKNNFTGQLHPNLVSGMQRVILFNVRNNNLSGEVPNGQMVDGVFQGWRTKERLRTMYLGGNNFTGPLPDMPEYVGDISQIILNGNGFTGTIPDSWEELYTPALRNVNPDRTFSLCRLGDNDLQGVLPAWFTAENGITNQTGGNRWCHRDILENGVSISDGEGLGIKPFGQPISAEVAVGESFDSDNFFDYSQKIHNTDTIAWTKFNPGTESWDVHDDNQDTFKLFFSSVQEVDYGSYRLELTNTGTSLPNTVVSEVIVLTEFVEEEET